MRENYYGYQGFWQCRKIKLVDKKEAYKSQIYSTAMAGLECEVITNEQYKRLERMNTRLMRKMAGEETSYVTEGGERRQCSNASLRMKFGVATIESEMRRRRCQWYKRIMQDKEEAKQIRAALIGTEEEEEGGENPWKKQMWDDIDKLWEVNGEEGRIREKIRERGIKMLFEEEWRKEYKEKNGKLLREVEETMGGGEGEEREGEERCDQILEDGRECEYRGTRKC